MIGVIGGENESFFTSVFLCCLAKRWTKYQQLLVNIAPNQHRHFQLILMLFFNNILIAALHWPRLKFPRKLHINKHRISCSCISTTVRVMTIDTKLSHIWGAGGERMWQLNRVVLGQVVFVWSKGKSFLLIISLSRMFTYPVGACITGILSELFHYMFWYFFTGWLNWDTTKIKFGI